MPTFIPAKLRNKRTDETLTGYRCERLIRGVTVDMFVYRRGCGFGRNPRLRWRVLHYPTGFLLGTEAFMTTRKEAVETVAEHVALNVSDYALSQADRRTFDAERCFAAPCEAVG